jgi:hypothetical protein
MQLINPSTLEKKLITRPLAEPLLILSLMDSCSESDVRSVFRGGIKNAFV